MEKEIWKDIEGYEGHYQVSNIGRIKRLEKSVMFGSRIKKLKVLILKTYRKTDGYWFVRLSKNDIPKNFYVHRLVAIAFIPNPENKPEVNHINGIKSENNILNLEWNSKKENIIHGYRNGLQKASRKGVFGSDNKCSKPILQFDLNGNLIQEFDSGVIASKETGLSRGNISSCLKGKIKHTGGFIWKYKLQNQQLCHSSI